MINGLLVFVRPTDWVDENVGLTGTSSSDGQTLGERGAWGF